MRPAAEYGDIYQDVRVDGRVIYPGWRNCSDRWAAIAPYIPQRGVVLEIGSNAGYFAQRIAEVRPDVVVWSWESVPERAVLQRDMLSDNCTPNVLLTQRRFGVHEAVQLLGAVNPVDCVLALSMLEYYEPAELHDLLSLLSRLSPMLICEFPRPAEQRAGAAPQTIAAFDPIEDQLRRWYEIVVVIAQVPSATDPAVMRPIIMARNISIYREGLTSYLNSSSSKRHTLSSGGTGHWVLDGACDLTDRSGVNAFNALYFGLLWPDGADLAAAADGAYRQAARNYGTLTDVHPRNVVLGPRGPCVIDCLEHYAKRVVYGRRRYDFVGELLGFEFIFEGWFENRLSVLREAFESGTAEPYRVGWERFV